MKEIHKNQGFFHRRPQDVGGNYGFGLIRKQHDRPCVVEGCRLYWKRLFFRKNTDLEHVFRLSVSFGRKGTRKFGYRCGVYMLHTLSGTEYVWSIKGVKKVRNRACFGNTVTSCVFRLAIRRGIIEIEIPVRKSDAPESDSGGI